jgi:hypothetical protein
MILKDANKDDGQKDQIVCCPLHTLSPLSDHAVETALLMGWKASNNNTNINFVLC